MRQQLRTIAHEKFTRDTCKKSKIRVQIKEDNYNDYDDDSNKMVIDDRIINIFEH